MTFRTLQIFLATLLMTLCLCLSPAQAQVYPQQRQIVFPTPVVRCLGVQELPIYTFPYAVTIWRVEIWIGTDGANPNTQGRFPPVDTYTSLDTSLGVTLHLGFDHYAPFTGRHDKEWDFIPETALRLPIGGQLRVTHSCLEVGGLLSHSQTNVQVTYTIDLF